ncbi:hypothetical protein P7C70_g5585, partial [Phenoliferia sp. Uapishka_3]
MTFVTVEPASLRTTISASSPIRFDSATNEPYLPFPSTSKFASFRLTPPRLSDVPCKVAATNSSHIQPWLNSAPVPATDKWALQSIVVDQEEISKFLDDWPREVRGCPFRVIREVTADGDSYAGEMQVGREMGYVASDTQEERTKLMEMNLARAAGDPEIDWRIGSIMFGFGTIINVVSTVSSFFALDQSLGNFILTSTSAVVNISRASQTVGDDATAVSSFFGVDSPTARRRPAKATSKRLRSSQSSATSSTAILSPQIDDHAAAVSAFFDVDSPASHRRPACATPRSRQSSRRSSPSSTATSSPKIVVDTSFLAPLSADHLDTLSSPPRAPQWTQDLPISATQLHPRYFESLQELEMAMKKRAERKEKKERARV